MQWDYVGVVSSTSSVTTWGVVTSQESAWKQRKMYKLPLLGGGPRKHDLTSKQYKQLIHFCFFLLIRYNCGAQSRLRSGGYKSGSAHPSKPGVASEIYAGMGAAAQE